MQKDGEIRIIGGEWRSRRIHFAATPGLRPTPDRVRETLFNWLAPTLRGERCLDLFAGSGALGLEALSRGASHACFVESDSVGARQLRETLTMLAPGRFEVVRADVLCWLARESRPFDIVFLDPPFNTPLLAQALPLLESGGWLAPGARIYLELAAGEPLPELPAGWILHRSGKAGAVSYHLALRQPASGAQSC